MLVESESRNAIFAILSDIAPEVESEADIDLDANLREQVDLDSMDFLNLVTAVSERFKIDIPQKDYSELSSFNDLVKYIRAKKWRLQNSGFSTSEFVSACASSPDSEALPTPDDQSNPKLRSERYDPGKDH